MGTIAEGFLYFFAGVGAAALLRCAVRFFLRPARTGEVLLILPLRGHVSDVEHRLRHAMLEYQRIVTDVETGWLVCVDEGMDAETKQICETMCQQYSFLNLCTKAQLLQFL